MSALDFGARALAVRAGAQAPRTFAALAASALHDQVERIESAGHAATGRGAGAYVCDALATPALMAAHPAAVFAGAGKRHFRLLERRTVS